jgi:hypothetical protein
MRIALRYAAAPVLVACAAVMTAAATASAMAEPQPARTTGAPIASPDHGGVYCGQFCGGYSAYSNNPGGAAAPASYGVVVPSRDPLSAVSIRLPIVDSAGIPVPQH